MSRVGGDCFCTKIETNTKKRLTMTVEKKNLLMRKMGDIYSWYERLNLPNNTWCSVFHSSFGASLLLARCAWRFFYIVALLCPSNQLVHKVKWHERIVVDLMSIAFFIVCNNYYTIGNGIRAKKSVYFLHHWKSNKCFFLVFVTVDAEAIWHSFGVAKWLIKILIKMEKKLNQFSAFHAIELLYRHFFSSSDNK